MKMIMRPLGSTATRFLCLFLLIGFALVGSSCASTSEETAQTFRVGFLAGADSFNVAMDGFQAGMAELGYVDGENISYDFQRADGDRAEMKKIAEQFVADGVDLIFTTTTGAAQEAQMATAESKIPVVFTVVSDPVGSGVVADLRQPGDNITGATRSLSGLISKRVAFLHGIIPGLQKIWLPYEDGYATMKLTLDAVHKVADPEGIDVIKTPINTVDDLLAEIEQLSELDTLEFDAIVIAPDPTVQNEQAMAALMSFANEQGLAVVANAPDQVRNGALLTYSDDTYQSGYLAASLADKIFDGAEPGTIPVAFVEPNLYINFKNSQALNLTIDDSLLAQAAEVVR